MADLEKTDWKVHLAAQQNSGLSSAEYCDRHDLKAYKLSLSQTQAPKI